jgi:hypothetical protein
MASQAHLEVQLLSQFPPGIMLPSLWSSVYPAMGQHFQRLTRFCLVLASLCLFVPIAAPQQSPETIAVDQIHAGMQGYAYTIFAGDQVEKFDLEVLGIMPNFLGPKQSIILVELKGPKV